MRRITRTTALATMALTLSLGMAACSTEDDDAAKNETSSSATPMETPMASETAEPADGPFGPGCAALPESGPGSAEEMAKAPVATAASGSDLLSTLVAAVSEAGLVETLDNAEALTLFAPTNEAFEAVGEEALNDLLADKEALTAVLTHHVVAGQLGPDEVGGTHETLNGDTIEVKGSGTEWTVADEEANVVCGNVKTANAVVYVIDKVLLP